MNICYVFRAYPVLDNTSATGIGNYIKGVAKELSKNHSVTVVTESNQLKNLKVNGVQIHSLKRIKLPNVINKNTLTWLIYNFKVTWCLWKLNRINHFDVVEFGTYENEGFLFSLICYMFNSPISIVCRLHTGTLESYTFNNGRTNIPWSIRIINFFERAFVNLPNVHLVTSTKAHKIKATHVYKLKHKEILINPIGVDLPKINTGYLQKKIGVGLRILFTGRTDRRKGIQTLIQSTPYILAKYPNTYIDIIGKGNIDIFPLIHKHISSTMLSQIRYHGYMENPESLKYFYQNADICVFPSIYESFGLTIAEAMSYGKAVISTKVGGIPEVIENGRTGILIKPNNPKLLAATIVKLIEDKPLRLSLGKNALATVKDKFTLNKLAERTVLYYASIKEAKYI